MYSTGSHRWFTSTEEEGSEDRPTSSQGAQVEAQGPAGQMTGGDGGAR